MTEPALAAIFHDFLNLLAFSPRTFPSQSSIVSHIFPICLVAGIVEGFQRFSEQPKYTEVNPAEDTLLTCKVIDKRGTCSWQKDNKVIISAQRAHLSMV